MEGQTVADLCVVSGYAQYAIRPAAFLVPVSDGIDPAEAVCIPLAYLTAFQMLTRCRNLAPDATLLIIGASGTVGTALLDLARHLGLKAIGTCSAANLSVVERFGAAAIDYRAVDFVASVRRLTADRRGGPGVDIVFDAIGGAHFGRSFACLAPAGCSLATDRKTMGIGGESLIAAGLGLLRLSCGAHSVSYSAAVAPFSTALRHAERHTRRNSRPTWRRCFGCCARAPFVHRDRPTAARRRARSSRPNRQGWTRREDCIAPLCPP